MSTMTDPRWSVLRDVTWFRAEQDEVTAYVEGLRAEAERLRSSATLDNVIHLSKDNDALRVERASLQSRLAEWESAGRAAEQVLAYWAAKPEGQIWRHPRDGDQDPNGTNAALASLRDLLRAREGAK